MTRVVAIEVGTPPRLPGGPLEKGVPKTNNAFCNVESSPVSLSYSFLDRHGDMLLFGPFWPFSVLESQSLSRFFCPFSTPVRRLVNVFVGL